MKLELPRNPKFPRNFRLSSIFNLKFPGFLEWFYESSSSQFTFLKPFSTFFCWRKQHFFSWYSHFRKSNTPKMKIFLSFHDFKAMSRLRRLIFLVNISIGILLLVREIFIEQPALFFHACCFCSAEAAKNSIYAGYLISFSRNFLRHKYLF